MKDTSESVNQNNVAKTLMENNTRIIAKYCHFWLVNIKRFMTSDTNEIRTYMYVKKT